VNHFKIECYGFDISPCFRTRSSLEEEWVKFYDQIEGFDYEWGYVYKLKVRVYELHDSSETPEDASRYKYILDEVISKEQQPTSNTFDFAVSRSYGPIQIIVEQATGIYELYGEKTFECTPEMCSVVESLITQDLALLFEFSHSATPSDPLQLVQIKCSSSREAFYDSCLTGSQLM
jgi:hypothetical protein